jgi:hypothetical protein
MVIAKKQSSRKKILIQEFFEMEPNVRFFCYWLFQRLRPVIKKDLQQLD